MSFEELTGIPERTADFFEDIAGRIRNGEIGPQAETDPPVLTH